MKIVLFLVLLISFEAAAFDHTHAKWNEVLERSVVVNGTASTVRYKQLKSDDRLLKEYLASLGAVSRDEYGKFGDAHKKAFLINAYNACTVDLIIANYPVKSIKRIGGLFGSPWKLKTCKLFGTNVTLDHIEHELARGQFDEPRFHFAFVCASIGCPQLGKEAWTAEKIELQLKDASERFLSDPTRNRYLRDKKKLELSSIFKWYRQDFDRNGRSLEDFIAQHMPLEASDKALIRDKKVSISFLPYDWNLNE